MEGKLKALFDYQRFEGNPALRQVIDEVHSRHTARELSLDEMNWVAAAGVPTIPCTDKKGEDGSSGS